MSLNQFKIEKVYRVFSFRDHRNGQISHDIFDNLSREPRGWRPVFGTGTTNLELAKKRLTMCEKNLWFKNQHKQRRRREAEDNRYRKRLHDRFTGKVPTVSSNFDWSKYDKMLTG